MPALTLTDALQHVRTLSEIGGIAVVVWRVIVFLHQTKESLVNTFTAIPVFMDGTTNSLKLINDNVNTAVTNHLTHMEDGIGKLAASTERLASTMEKHVIEMASTQAVILDRLP